ncbi:hypothetical protein M409DRAFT_20163 [Zasmidium cellare ATCC 36951]|uniref:HpcH/HpaI aldolase/citrate lyase domain-containing protein n=1 Tax=Zasmidium cellare ATCC 36951 TaxID=1080233 RepID=A0A6A6CU85_ZASCE|nr:uncharacterized protein M409DRAFT_20163 [Zasmidium cellare ATCC 36951]KAF2169748.1 hypothetical protein M409DRAFT_20163 [Zasmidium cellare ATCC 36951]
MVTTNGNHVTPTIQADIAVPNPMRDKMSQGDVASTLIIKMMSGVEAPMLAKSTGFDGIFIDMEHSQLDLTAVSQMCQAALLAGITPIVRSPTKEPFFVSRILDGGALGVVVPHIRSVKDAEDVVAAAKFAPIGRRSATGGLPQLGLRPIPAKKMSVAVNQSTIVCPMIETLEALEDVEKIAAVPGVDSLLIGSSDLTAEMGIPGDFDNPRVTEAYEKVIAACRKAGIFLGCGGLTARPDLIQKFCEKGGISWVMVAADQALLYGAAKQKADFMIQINENRRVKGTS